jgi:hypothetical protein
MKDTTTDIRNLRVALLNTCFSLLRNDFTGSFDKIRAE